VRLIVHKALLRFSGKLREKDEQDHSLSGRNGASNGK
jgi:hypothetical protein